MSVGESIVVADGWGWRFGASPSVSVDSVSFTIDAGERVLLLGPSGSGKSTLLRAIAGLLGEDEGHAHGLLTINGVDARFKQSRVGVVLQDPDTQAVLHTVGDDVAFGCENFGVASEDIWSRVMSSLEQVGLRVPLTRSTSALSGGQKQRLALAGALAIEPDLLVLDEPTANLDPESARKVRDSVLETVRNRETTVILVEHRLDLWWDFATRVIVLGADGSLIADGSPSAVLSEAQNQLDNAGIWLPSFTFTDVRERTTGEPLIEARELTVARRSAPAARTGISCAISEGEFLAFTGPNGSGKTTLALTLGGLLPGQSGDLTAHPALAQGASQVPFRWTSKQLHARIGNVFQNPGHQFVRPTVFAELELSAKTSGMSGSSKKAAVDEMLERMSLNRFADAHPFSLSGGQQRRLSVATALIARPRLLVLDEPTFGQDAHTWRELVTLMGQLCSDGKAIVAMTHDPHVVSSADREISFGEAS